MARKATGRCTLGSISGCAEVLRGAPSLSKTQGSRRVVQRQGWLENKSQLPTYPVSRPPRIAPSLTALATLASPFPEHGWHVPTSVGCVPAPPSASFPCFIQKLCSPHPFSHPLSKIAPRHAAPRVPCLFSFIAVMPSRLEVIDQVGICLAES